MTDDYLQHNRDHWNKSTDPHFESEFYDVEGWLSGKESLREPELELLPKDLKGSKLLHLQCHFGQDTLSLARRGASVTGVDLSDRAIERANELAGRAGLSGRFINCDVYSLREHLPEPGSFDVVFSTYGTIGWLPDLDRWAALIEHYLAPGGVLVFADFHPVVWMLDTAHRSFEYSYFKREPIVDHNTGSYTDGSETIESTEVGWNHSFDELLGALLRHGLTLEVFREYDFSAWNCFADTVEVGPNRFQFRGLEGKLPLMYALRARKSS
ncbi:MAG: class I SAM-dependent methyltransferase [Deltaproteobacteria bacterium]|nr:class I SAM-dependent methyltransferase [Deltaproteobacteria bacterium]